MVLTVSRPKLLAVADSDSYLKWCHATVGALGEEYDARVVVVAGATTPSARQIEDAAFAGPLRGRETPVLGLDEVAFSVRETRPDIVLLAARGPMVDCAARAIVSLSGPRPVLATGLPGMSIPATARALTFRSACDVFAVHSVREVREFSRIATGGPLEGRVALATLPFLTRTEAAAARSTTQPTTVVFAAQARVPARLEERTQIVEALAALARRMPSTTVVCKVRALDGESQTHAERFSYASLVEGLGADKPTNLVVKSGSMADALATASGFVTLSSTAVLEAVAAKVPAIVISDFGVNDELLNRAFEDSGLLGTLENVSQGAFRDVRPTWVEDNYFHAQQRNDFAERLRDQLRVRRARELRAPTFDTDAWSAWRQLMMRSRALGATEAAVAAFPRLVPRQSARFLVEVARPPLKGIQRARAYLRRIARLGRVERR